MRLSLPPWAAAHDQRGRGRAERIATSLPTPLIEYPFECLIAGWGLISAPPLLLGVTTPVSISSTLPPLWRFLWALGLMLGSLSVAVGLYRHQDHRSMVRGLTFLGCICLAYATAILYAIGMKGIPTGPLLTVIAALCWVRSIWLTAFADIRRRIAEASE